MIAKADFIAQLDRGASVLGQLPVTSGILRFVSEELKKGDPAWWKKIQKAWEKRSFGSWSSAFRLLLTCIHFDALNDAQSPLVAFFPSCGGTAEADPSTALRVFFNDPPSLFYEKLRDGAVRSYDPWLGSFWYGPAAMFFQKRQLSFYLAQVNAGSGLDLVTDLKSKVKGGFDPGLVSARIGLDPKPLLVEDISDRRWLTASLYPENMKAIQDLDNTIESFKTARSKEPNFVQLVQCRAAVAPKFLAKNVPVDEDVGLLIFNTMATSAFTPDEQTAYAADMLSLMRPWGNRALWVEAEHFPTDQYSMTLQVRVHGVSEGLLKSAELGRFDFAAKKQDFELKRGQPVFDLAARKA